MEGASQQGGKATGAALTTPGKHWEVLEAFDADEIRVYVTYLKVLKGWGCIIVAHLERPTTTTVSKIALYELGEGLVGQIGGSRPESWRIWRFSRHPRATIVLFSGA